MNFVRPIYFQGGRVLLVEFDYTLKMLQRKRILRFLGNIQWEYDAVDCMHILIFIRDMATIEKSSG